MKYQVPLFWTTVSCVSALKFLLMPSYKSTDFEVHRNWLAITHNLPLKKWYYEDTSQWTLDYPPFFAWFECGLSYIAALFDPKMLKIENQNYSSAMTVIYQRLSVIVTDLVYAYAVNRCCKLFCSNKQNKADMWADDRFITSVILLTNIGLLMVDHMHFQYNGFLFGIFLLSVCCLAENRHMEGAFWFSVLLNFKHIFLYTAPVYFIFLLRNYCFKEKLDEASKWKWFSVTNFLKLALLVSTVFTASFGPFVWQVGSRLFPFKRGLTHAYWAPNFWALYSFLDKLLTLAGSKLKLIDSTNNSSARMTGGLVQEYSHAVLPSVAPIATIILTVASIMPSVVILWKRPGNHWDFVRSVCLSALGSFIFGWHVHEKAILMAIIPFSLLVVSSDLEARLFFILSAAGHYSLFPLLFKEAETPTKLLLYISYVSYTYFSFSILYRKAFAYKAVRLELLYLLGMFGVYVYSYLIHDLFGFFRNLPFLPLMLTSVYCSTGVIYVWLKLNYLLCFPSKPKRN